MSYLVMPHLKIQAANVHTAGWLLGGPPVMASVLFGHALARDLACTVAGVALVHHDQQLLGEWGSGRWRPQQRRAAALTFTNKLKNGKDYASTNAHALSLQPVACAHMDLSLVIEVDGLHAREAVQERLAHARLAGGNVVSYGEPSLVDDERDLASVLVDVDRQFGIGSGFVVRDRSDLLAPTATETRTDRLIRALGVGPNHARALTTPSPWLSPACLGYAALTPFALRDGIREGARGYSHGFVEPLIGLVQYESLRVADAKTLNQSLWRAHWPLSDVFAIRHLS